VEATRPDEPPVGPPVQVWETWTHSTLDLTTHTDAAGRQTIYRTTPDGLLDRVTKVVGAQLHHTTYDYAPFGLVDTVTDPVGNVSLVEYDVLGRPVMVLDPSTGVLEKGYTARGQLSYTRDDNGHIREFDYDSLGRLIRRATEDGADYYGYDWGTGAIGQLSTTLSADGVETAHLYDALGRPIFESYKFGPAIFPIELDYDAIGRLSKIHYPTAPSGYQLTVRHDYGLYGDLDKIVDETAQRPIWTRLERDAAGRVTQAERGSALRTAYAYDRFIGRPTQIKAYTPQGSLFEQNMEYDADGRLHVRSDVATGVHETYEYDALGRLEFWTVDRQGTERTRKYEFGTAGTLDAVIDYGGSLPINNESYSYPPVGGPRPHAPSTAGPYTLDYDAVGRQTHRYQGASLERYVEYNSHDLPKLGAFDGTTFSLLYDASGRRFRKEVGGAFTYYAGDLFELRSGPAGDRCVYYVYGEEGLIAQLDHDLQSGLTLTNFPIADQLGTPVAIIDEAATTVERLHYTPYGRRIDHNGAPASNPTSIHGGLTSHEHDDDLGFINMRGRVFDAGIRRFASPDPILAGVLDGGGVDRFGYVGQDPTNVVDPSGYTPEPVSCEAPGYCGSDETILVITGTAPTHEGGMQGSGNPGADGMGLPDLPSGGGSSSYMGADAMWGVENFVNRAGPSSFGGYERPPTITFDPGNTTVFSESIDRWFLVHGEKTADKILTGSLVILSAAGGFAVMGVRIAAGAAGPGWARPSCSRAQL
jgi:RHS repeat-associated protein